MTSSSGGPGILTYLLVIVIKLVDIFVIFPITVLASLKKTKKCPAITNNLLLIPATQLARDIRRGNVSSKTVVSAYINRIREVNGIVNAVIEERFDEALQEADKADELVASDKYSQEEIEEKYPLLGVPVTVKGSIAVKGLPLMGGMYFENVDQRRAKHDADIVLQVKEAGGVVLLISSSPELCKSFECSNKIIGTTRNPYDTRRTSGGSSGGEAVLLSTGASVIGLGSDMMGSCRLPAAFCGVYGHKPSALAVSLEGHYPDSDDREAWTKNFSLGPMTRYAADLPVLLEILLKPEKRMVLNLREAVNLRNVKIYYCYSDNGNVLTHKVDDAITAGIRKTVEYFRDVLGCQTKEMKLRKLRLSTSITILRLISMNSVDDIFDKQPKSAIIELFKLLFYCSDHSLSAIAYVLAKRFFDKCPTTEQMSKINKALISLREEFQSFLQDDGVFLYPTTCNPAFFHGQIFGNFFDGSYTGLFNVLGFPATSCPIGLNSGGLPIGIQVVANMDCDRLTMAVSQEIEKAFGGWRAPPFL